MPLTPLAYFDLLETFPESGCAVCNLLLRDADRFLNTLMYERVMSPDVHQSFRQSRGLCNLHGWQLTGYRNALGAATLADAALDELLNILDDAVPNGNPARGLSRLLFSSGANAQLTEALSPTAPCIVCVSQDESEARYLHTLSQYLYDERLQAAYIESEGLCLAHVRRMLQMTTEADRSRRIVDIQREIWRALQAELREFMRKNDFQHADETIGAEGTSWLRTIARLSGERGVFGSERKHRSET